MLPNAQSLNYWRTSLGGALFTFTFTGTFWGLYTLARPTIDNMGMALLALALPMFIIGLALSLAVALAVTFSILPKELQQYRWYVLGFASLLALGTMLLIEFFRPQTTPLLNIACSAIASGFYFFTLATLARSNSRTLVKAIVPLLMLTGMVIALVSLRYHGTTTAQVAGMKSAGYGIYIPNPSLQNVPHAQYVRPEDGEYDKYDESIEVTLTELSENNTFNKLYLSKHRGPVPDVDCISKEPLPEYDEAAGEITSMLCTLISQTKNISIYRKETVSSTRGYKDKGTYFAIAGNTKITTSYDGKGNDVETGKKVLENLVLLQEKDYSKYVIKY